MFAFESRTTRVAFFGRFSDAVTRRSAPIGSFHVKLEDDRHGPIYKEDGSFAFIELEPSLTLYSISVRGAAFRSREVEAVLPSTDAVSLARAGEDELYVAITSVDGPQSRVNFAPIPFLPTVAEGIEVIGPGGFNATLQETIEGEDVDFAVLSSIAGLAPGDVLRMIRSDRLLLRPGPYYRFSEPATVLSVRFTENSPSAEPIANVRLLVNRVNGVATTTVTISGTVLHQVLLGGDLVVFGPQSAIDTNSNERGEALLDLPAHLPITSLRVQVSHPQYVSVTQNVAMTAGGVTRWTPLLTPV